MFKHSLSAAACACMVFAAAAASARPASTNVDISGRAYRDIGKLVSYGLCRPPMIDQRPLARGEFARLIAEARSNFSVEDEIAASGEGFEAFSKKLQRRNAIGRIMARLTREFGDELADLGATQAASPAVRGHPIEHMTLDAMFMSSAPLRIPVDNGIGPVSATVNPFLGYRSGRHAVDGFQNAAELEGRFRITRHLALLARPRFEVNIWRGDEDMKASALLQEGYALVQFGGVAFELGRGQIVWGPGEHGGLLLTNNARPLDHIAFKTPSPFRLPWMLKHLGQWKVTLFGANLGPEQARRYAWLTGYRLSYMPVRYLELGFGNVTMMGGGGSPALSAIDVVGEFLGFRPAGTSAAAPNKTNHIMEASLLVRIPPLAGLELYGVLNNDDKRDSLKRFFRDGSAYLAGFHLPRIGNRGASSMRAEFRRTSAIHYRHGLFTNGYTLNDMFIGDDLGPDAMGLHARYDYDLSDKLSLSATFDWETRRADTHAVTTDPDGTLGDTYVLAGGPHEHRYRFVAMPWVQVSDALALSAMAGYERAINAGYVNGVSRNNWLAAISLKIDLDRHFRFDVK